MTAHSDEVKVLYIAGKGRSGSTILASLLGQLPGFFNAGEVNRLWDWGLISNYKCGCGLPQQSCPTWQEILERADALLEGTGIPPLTTARIDIDQATVARWPRMLKLLRAKPGPHPHWQQLDRYTAAVSAVYRAIAHVTGARVIVDSSKIPIEPIALGLVPGVDVRIAQLVRDPRAVVYSWKRSRVLVDRDDPEYMPRFSSTFSTTSWLVRNGLVELLRRRREVDLVSYDAMARDPAAVLQQLADFVGEPVGDMAFLTDETATLAPTHSVGGNPVRMASGAVTMKPDDEWRAGIAGRDRIVTTAMALPLLRRYGLTVRSKPTARATKDDRRGTRVLVIGTFDPNTPRSRQWFRLLDRLGCVVDVRNVGSWGPDRASQTATSPVQMLRSALRGSWPAARYLLTCERPDVVVFLYPGHLDACLLGPIARMRRIPAVLDVFISLYDTAISDRGLRSARSPLAFATRALDTLACWSVRTVVVDTPEHADFFARFTHRDRDHFDVLWVGAEEARFVPAPDPGDGAAILWYLTYIPLHGFETVARAARLLRADDRVIRVIGNGQQRAAAEQLARDLELTNVEFVDSVSEDELPGEIAKASICLGVFGTSDKAARVVPNKVFQCAAAGRPVITAATPAVTNAFGDALVTVPVGDAEALADAVGNLRGQARLDAAASARAVFLERFSEAALAEDLGRILSHTIGARLRG